ncbi:hypothetical protein ABE494_06420 [Stenotrophomonas lactitubi]|uniref:hypothetical protein n=1 Tax=Stenotrophomonas lactitubi TaxID=2045214 RepID=UPI002041E626|nr:hypothetical protein [Stenotrophomonas lactitubi]
MSTTSASTKAGEPVVSDTLRAMRDAARAGGTVPAEQVGEWFQTIRDQLYAEQRPVRLEACATGSPHWIQVDERGWHRARKERQKLRALYVHPLPEERRKGTLDHTWSADRTHCTRCNSPHDWAEPFCDPPKEPVRIPLKRQPYNPLWVVPALDRLERAMRREGKQEREYWNREIAQMRRSIEEHTKETQP